MMAGRCQFCGHPFDEHKLPPIGTAYLSAIIPICPPPTLLPKKKP